MEKRMVMKALIFSLVAFFATTCNAQTEPMQQYALPTEWDISIDGPVSDSFENTEYAKTKINLTPNPCHGCWGITEIPVLSDSDRVALRLYPSEKTKWYDFKTYRFKGHGKRAVWIGYVAAGVLHGGREAYQADRTIFEKRLGVEPRSFFGSEQWVRQYKNHDPEQPHKNNLFNGFRDYWHFSGATTKYILIGGAFTIGHSKQPLKYKILDTIIGFAGFSLTANLTYNILR